MIDSIIYYDAASKVGTKATSLTDLNIGRLARYVSSGDFDFSSVTPIKIVTAPATFDGNGNQLTAVQYAPGFGSLLATEDQATADELWALPDNLCRLQLDRKSGKVLRRRISLALLRTLSVEPMFAGCNYAFASITE